MYGMTGKAVELAKGILVIAGTVNMLEMPYKVKVK